MSASTPPPQEPGQQTLQGQAALLKLIADASVAAVAIGEYGQAEALRLSLHELVPQYDGHLAHYVVALIDQRQWTLAETVLNEADPDGASREMLACTRGILKLARNKSGWKNIFKQLQSTASDPEVRQAAAYWHELGLENMRRAAA